MGSIARTPAFWLNYVRQLCLPHHLRFECQVDRVFWLLRQLLTPENARMLEDDPRADQPLALRRFLDTRSRVTSWPSKREDRAMVLSYIASKFEAGREYTEKEVNEIINSWHTYADHATLRRELFSNKLIGRTSDGARYWLVVEA